MAEEKKLRNMSIQEQFELELQCVEEDIAWYDMKIRSDQDMMPLNAQKKFDLLKKKYAIVETLKLLK